VALVISRRTSLSASLLASAWIVGCQVGIVDLGDDGARRDAGTDAPIDLGPVTTSNCPVVTEAQVQALAGTTCTGACNDAFGPPRAVESSAELIAVTAGRWETCAGGVPWAADVIGIEFQAGCTLFLLHDAPDGGSVRGVTPDDQGTFNVIETSAGLSVTRAVEMYFPTWTARSRVTTSDCPHRMRLDVTDGGVTEFAAIPSKAPPLQ